MNTKAGRELRQAARPPRAKTKPATVEVVGHDDSGLPEYARRDAMRRCVGSKTFGIEPHDAPAADFPIQPSRKDGLGVMCKPHWTEYTRGLRQAQRARQAGDTASGGVYTAPVAEKATAAPTRARAAKAPKADPALAAAKALVAEVDGLPADQYVKRIGDDDVQAALETIGNGHGREGAGETPLGETIDGGTEEADAATADAEA